MWEVTSVYSEDHEEKNSKNAWVNAKFLCEGRCKCHNHCALNVELSVVGSTVRSVYQQHVRYAAVLWRL